MVRLRLLSAACAIAACSRSSPSPPPPASEDKPAPASPSPRQDLVEIARTTPLEPPLGSGASSPSLVATPDGVLLTWLEPIAAAPSAHRFRFSRLVRRAWSPPATITQGARLVANWADVPSLARQADGALVAHWAETTDLPNAHGYHVVVARSRDGGATWKRLGVIHRDRTDTEHGFVSLVPDAGAVTAFWLDGRAMANGQPGATSLRAARIGETIEGETLLDERVCDCCNTAAAATSDGPVVTYRDRSADELRDPGLARRAAGVWTEPRAVHADGWRITGCPVNGPAIATLGRDLAVAWYTRADGRPSIRIAFSSDAGQTFDRAIEVDSSRGELEPLGRVDVVLEGPGEAVVSWSVGDNDTAHLQVRRVARDRRRSAALEIAHVVAGRNSGFPRMERMGNDLVFAWTDPTAATVKASLLELAHLPPLTAPASASAAPARAPFPIGSQLPAYQATTLEGAEVSFGKLENTPVLVNIWATWCEPCRRELPMLAALQQRHAPQGLQVIAVSVDRELPRHRITELGARLGTDLAFWHDPEDRISLALGAATVPTTLLFDRAGKLIWRTEGAIAEGDRSLERAIELALAR